jgi:hypothetical protein
MYALVNIVIRIGEIHTGPEKAGIVMEKHIIKTNLQKYTRVLRVR